MRLLILGLLSLVTSIRDGSAATAEGAGDSDEVLVEVSFAGYSSAPAVAVGTLPARGQVSIEEAYVSLGDVRLRERRRCDRAGGILLAAGPILGDLIAGRAAAGETLFRVPAARYCRAEYSTRRAPAGGAPGMRGYTVLVRGRRDDGARFVIRSRRRELVQLVAPAEGVKIAAGRSRLFLAADLGRWMSGIDLGAVPPGRGRDETIRIDDGSNRGVLRAFEQNLLAGLSLCRDDDDDGTLSPRERSPGACFTHVER